MHDINFELQEAIFMLINVAIVNIRSLGQRLLLRAEIMNSGLTESFIVVCFHVFASLSLSFFLFTPLFVGLFACLFVVGIISEFDPCIPNA